MLLRHPQEEEACWKWKKPPPVSKKPVNTGNPEDTKRARRAIRQTQNVTVREKLLKGVYSPKRETHLTFGRKL